MYSNNILIEVLKKPLTATAFNDSMADPILWSKEVVLT